MADTDGWNGGRRHDEQGYGLLLNRLKQLERQVAELQRGAPLRAAGIGASPDGLTVHSSLDIEGELTASGDTDITGDTTIGGTLAVGADTEISGDLGISGNATVRDGGQMRVRYPDSLGTTESAVYFGDLYDGGGGYIGTGILANDPAGNQIWAAKSDANGSTHSFGVRDNNDYEVLAIRDNTPRGLSSPSFSPHMAPRKYDAWAGTDQSTWDTVMEGGCRIWHGTLWVSALATTDEASTAGEVRFAISHDGTDYQIGATESVGFGIGQRIYSGDIPAAIPIGDFVLLKLLCRRTSGTGKVRGAVLTVLMG